MNNTAIEGNRQPEGGGDVTDPVGCHVIGVFRRYFETGT